MARGTITVPRKGREAFKLGHYRVGLKLRWSMKRKNCAIVATQIDELFVGLLPLSVSDSGKIFTVEG